jgi:hypothetical protein
VRRRLKKFHSNGIFISTHTFNIIFLSSSASYMQVPTMQKIIIIFIKPKYAYENYFLMGGEGVRHWSE